MRTWGAVWRRGKAGQPRRQRQGAHLAEKSREQLAASRESRRLRRSEDLRCGIGPELRKLENFLITRRKGRPVKVKNVVSTGGRWWVGGAVRAASSELGAEPK